MDIYSDPTTSHLLLTSHEIANPRDSGKRTRNNKGLQSEPKTCAQEIKTFPCSTRLTNMTRRTDHFFGMGPEKRRKREDDMNSSKGVQKDAHEDTHISTSEGAAIGDVLQDIISRGTARSLQLDASKDLSRMIKKTRAEKIKNTRKVHSKFKGKISSLDVVTDETQRTHRYRNRAKRTRKQAKIRSALLSLPELAEETHGDKDRKTGQTT